MLPFFPLSDSHLLCHMCDKGSDTLGNIPIDDLSFCFRSVRMSFDIIIRDSIFSSSSSPQILPTFLPTQLLFFSIRLQLFDKIMFTKKKNHACVCIRCWASNLRLFECHVSIPPLRHTKDLPEELRLISLTMNGRKVCLGRLF